MRNKLNTVFQIYTVIFYEKPNLTFNVKIDIISKIVRFRTVLEKNVYCLDLEYYMN